MTDRFVTPLAYYEGMSETKETIKVLHFYNFMAGSDTQFPHEVTAIANDQGFTYISKIMTEEQSTRRAKRILERVSNKKKQRESEGNPLNSADYLQISQIGMTYYYAKPGEIYEENLTFEQVVALEREILNEHRTEVVSRDPKKKSPNQLGFTDTPLIGSLVLPPMTPEVLEEVDQVLQDFPDLLEALDSGADINTSGMIELVFALVGSIHPDDPNGWVLDYLDEFGNLKSENNE